MTPLTLDEKLLRLFPFFKLLTDAGLDAHLSYLLERIADKPLDALGAINEYKRRHGFRPVLQNSAEPVNGGIL